MESSELKAAIMYRHSIDDDPQIHANRIGTNTGTYESYRLTALGLENDASWFLSTPASA